MPKNPTFMLIIWAKDSLGLGIWRVWGLGIRDEGRGIRDEAQGTRHELASRRLGTRHKAQGTRHEARGTREIDAYTKLVMNGSSGGLRRV